RAPRTAVTGASSQIPARSPERRTARYDADFNVPTARRATPDLRPAARAGVHAAAVDVAGPADRGRHPGRTTHMAQLLLLPNALAPSAEVLPALGLLPHQVRVLPAEAAVLVDAPAADAVVVDGRRDLAGARSLCRLLRATGLSAPLLLVLTEGGMAAVVADWGADDVVLDSAGPAEAEARLRLATGRNRLGGAAGEPGSAASRAG